MRARSFPFPIPRQPYKCNFFTTTIGCAKQFPCRQRRSEFSEVPANWAAGTSVDLPTGLLQPFLLNKTILQRLDVARTFGFDHCARRVLAVIVIDKLAEVIRIGQLITPIARSRKSRIDDTFHVVGVVPAQFTGFVRTWVRAELRTVVVCRLREYGRRVDGDVSTGKHAADHL